eukprot:scaffold2042_cov295-Pinguiococcus_pyrenoidosus.AAC.4
MISEIPGRAPPASHLVRGALSSGGGGEGQSPLARSGDLLRRGGGSEPQSDAAAHGSSSSGPHPHRLNADCAEKSPCGGAAQASQRGSAVGVQCRRAYGRSEQGEDPERSPLHSDSPREAGRRLKAARRALRGEGR